MEIKGIVHAHSAYSYDGKESLASLKTFLMQRGMTFCCVTEHTDFLSTEQAQRFIQECRSLSGSQFVFIPGFEVPYRDAHILLIGTEMFMGQTADARTLASWSERAAITVLAHPVRNKFLVDEAMLASIDAIEIWNQHYDGKRVPRPHACELLRTLQEKKPELMATGGLDFHRTEHYGAPVYSLEVSHITADAIIAVLKNGEYVFGTKKIAVSSTGLWKGKGSVLHNAMSFFSISVITIGKTINKLLSRFGWSLPRGLKQFIRSRV